MNMFYYLLGGLGLLSIVLVLGISIVYIALLWAVGEAADVRGRSKFGWILIGIFATPISAFLGLLCIGETEEQKEWRIRTEVELDCEFKAQASLKAYRKANANESGATDNKSYSKYQSKDS
ncbi:MAG: hypothetical protein LBN93_05300 [Candidatus Symbiothrix sp.]|jgi:hypothetical protein|nr:hypothetical protein [Candidatus Symbiothrix sp.]